MNGEDVLVDLRERIAHLEARTAIIDCIARHARGSDRHDEHLIGSAYWPDAVDEHGRSRNTGEDYGKWANQAHSATSVVHTHNVTTHTCEINGDSAEAESYVIVVLLGNDGRTAQFISGRYVDRLERRGGEWRIALRRSTVEVTFIADASVLQSSFFKEQGYIKGTRARDDVSYQRPLRLDGPEPARW